MEVLSILLPVLCLASALFSNPVFSYPSQSNDSLMPPRPPGKSASDYLYTLVPVDSMKQGGGGGHHSKKKKKHGNSSGIGGMVLKPVQGSYASSYHQVGKEGQGGYSHHEKKKSGAGGHHHGEKKKSGAGGHHHGGKKKSGSGGHHHGEKKGFGGMSKKQQKLLAAAQLNHLVLTTEMMKQELMEQKILQKKISDELMRQQQLQRMQRQHAAKRHRSAAHSAAKRAHAHEGHPSSMASQHHHGHRNHEVTVDGDTEWISEDMTIESGSSSMMHRPQKSYKKQQHNHSSQQYRHSSPSVQRGPSVGMKKYGQLGMKKVLGLDGGKTRGFPGNGMHSGGVAGFSESYEPTGKVGGFINSGGKLLSRPKSGKIMSGGKKGGGEYKAVGNTDIYYQHIDSYT
eukprot:GHVQ01033021.1.p1 GENE.GHVQ01033021.1~~GHVQ01033021.1.p1  ORF type:complete len:398 (+),score=79.43 GHVQ01033021.1:354-1547(+)